MQDSVEITLPISKKKVVIRNYTTRKDDLKSEEILYTGVDAEQSDSVKSGTKQKIKFPIANVMASEACYIPRLVQSIDGDSTNLKEQIEELRTPDYNAIEKEVNKIVEANSPKVVEAKKASKSTTTDK